jgi:hypothetical protein
MHTIETWERLQARLFHLGWLGEELPAFVATPGGTWLFREIAHEAQTIARIASTFLAESEKAASTSANADDEATAVADSGPVDISTETGGGEAL